MMNQKPEMQSCLGSTNFEKQLPAQSWLPPAGGALRSYNFVIRFITHGFLRWAPQTSGGKKKRFVPNISQNRQSGFSYVQSFRAHILTGLHFLSGLCLMPFKYFEIIIYIERASYDYRNLEAFFIIMRTSEKKIKIAVYACIPLRMSQSTVLSLISTA